MSQPSETDLRRHAVRIHNAQVRLSMDWLTGLSALSIVIAGLAPICCPAKASGWGCAALVAIGVGSFALARFLTRFIRLEEQ